MAIIPLSWRWLTELPAALRTASFQDVLNQSLDRPVGSFSLHLYVGSGSHPDSASVVRTPVTIPTIVAIFKKANKSTAPNFSL